MNDDTPTPTSRDQAARRAGRLKRTVIGTSIAASLGVASVLGLTAVHQTTVSSSGAASSTTGGSTDQSGASTPGSTTTLSSGSGGSVATTSGS